jgi:hypothetical protein
MLSSASDSSLGRITPEIARIINLIDDTAHQTYRLGLLAVKESRSGKSPEGADGCPCPDKSS